MKIWVVIHNSEAVAASNVKALAIRVAADYLTAQILPGLDGSQSERLWSLAEVQRECFIDQIELTSTNDLGKEE